MRKNEKQLFHPVIRSSSSHRQVRQLTDFIDAVYVGVSVYDVNDPLLRFRGKKLFIPDEMFSEVSYFSSSARVVLDSGLQITRKNQPFCTNYAQRNAHQSYRNFPQITQINHYLYKLYTFKMEVQI